VAKSDDFLSQAKRMGGLHFCPQTAEAWNEIAKILMRHCKTVEHASRVIDRFLSPGASEDFPTPGAVAQAARDTPADPKLDRPDLPAGCPDCEPYGGLWRDGKRGGVERCGCARGLKLSALDAIRAGSPELRKGGMRNAADFAKRAAGDCE